MYVRKILSSLMLILTFSMSQGQSDTIVENFNGICDQMTTPRMYIIDYIGSNGVEWDIKTTYSSSSWWGGLDDEGNIIEGVIHCGSLQWDETNSGYAKATLIKGIKTLSFQMRYGYQLVGGYIQVLIDGIEVARTDTLEDKEVHEYTFEIDADGPLQLELIPHIETDLLGGIIMDNLQIITSENTKPFYQVETLKDYSPLMDTLFNPLDTMRIYLFDEHCLEINGEFVEYIERYDDVPLTLGSVIDLVPGDSTNLYYWGSVVNGIDNVGSSSTVEVALPANNSTDVASFDTSVGDTTFEGTISFINGNIDLDLVVFKMNDAKNDYQLSYLFDTNKPNQSDSTGNGVQNGRYNEDPAIKFYPNPIQDFAYFDTNKELDYFEIFDTNGKLLSSEIKPAMTSDGHYRLNLGNLDPGVCFVRFRYTDNSFDAVKIIVHQ